MEIYFILDEEIDKRTSVFEVKNQKEALRTFYSYITKIKTESPSADLKNTVLVKLNSYSEEDLRDFSENHPHTAVFNGQTAWDEILSHAKES
ncbi:MAG: hypothetical protein FWB95_04075 [Treponema sp.]|nr:hypothetical protein [Treponema sp.]